jgi:hypothetical protein
VNNAPGSLDQLLEELADPDARGRAHRELNPTAAELEARERTHLEKKLQHPTPQAILRIITERGEAGAGEIVARSVSTADRQQLAPAAHRRGQDRDHDAASRVAKNVKYCLKGNARVRRNRSCAS